MSKPVVILSVVVIAFLLLTGVAYLGFSGSGVPVANAAPKQPVPTQTPIVIIIYCDPSGCIRMLQAPSALVSKLHNAPGFKVAPESIPSLIGKPPSHLAPVQDATPTAR
jgi:hypothetical protein